MIIDKMAEMKIKQCFKDIINSNPLIREMFVQLTDIGEIIFIGGAIRDFAIGKKPKDIDIIMKTNRDIPIGIFPYQVYKNRFGGYKITSPQIVFDIWSIKNNWAFQEHLLDEKEENIIKGTFFNFDALTYNFSQDVFDVSLYNEAFKNNRLDITLPNEYLFSHPFPAFNIVKAIRIKKIYGLAFSKKVSFYISHYLNHGISLNELHFAEQRNYREVTITSEDLESI